MSEDEVMRRLRAADPARGRHPDLASIRARMDGTPLATSGEHDVRREHGEHGDAALSISGRARRTSPKSSGTAEGRHTLVGVAAAATIALGAGGYLLGTFQADDEVPVAGAEDDREAFTDHAPPADAPAEGAPTDAPDGADGMEGMGQDHVIDDPWILGSATSSTTGTLIADGLSTQAPEPAMVSRLDSTIDVESALTEWTTALEVPEGEVEVAEGSATLTTEDAQYWVVDEEVGTPFVSYGSLVEPEDAEALERASDDEAIAIYSELIAAAGSDPDDFTFLTFETSDDAGIEVVAVPQTDEQWEVLGDVGWATFRGPHLASATVPLSAESTDLGEYPLLSPTEAVEEAADPRRQHVYLVAPYSAESVDLAEVEAAGLDMITDGQREYEPPQAVAFDAGDPIPAPAESLQVVDTQLIRAHYPAPDGSTYIVPACRAVTEHGTDVVVLALDNDSLEFGR